jgi:hypothetical protein
MAYWFDGFFCCGNEAVFKAAAACWPFCSVRHIQEPFCGIGVACPKEGKGAMANQIRVVRSSLIPWSRNFPGLTFVYLSAECFGGNCLYGGYACRNGTVLLEEPFDKNDDWEASQSTLRRLLRFLGVETDYFEPLTRGYFDRTQTTT